MCTQLGEAGEIAARTSQFRDVASADRVNPCTNTMGVFGPACVTCATTDATRPPATTMSGESARSSVEYLRKRRCPSGQRVSSCRLRPTSTRLLQSLDQRDQAQLGFRIICGRAHEHAEPPHTLRGLALPRRPHRRAAEQGDELAALIRSPRVCA